MIGLRMMLVSGGEKDIVVDVGTITSSGRSKTATINFSKPVRENTEFTFEWYGQISAVSAIQWWDDIHNISKDTTTTTITISSMANLGGTVLCRFKSADKPGYIRGTTGSY